MFRSLLLIVLIIIGHPLRAADSGFQSPTILILGDSQIPFGSGPVFHEFFENIKSHCPPKPTQVAQLDMLAEMKVAVIGVRSTSLHS